MSIGGRIHGDTSIAGPSVAPLGLMVQILFILWMGEHKSIKRGGSSLEWSYYG